MTSSEMEEFVAGKHPTWLALLVAAAQRGLVSMERTEGSWSTPPYHSENDLGKTTKTETVRVESPDIRSQTLPRRRMDRGARAHAAAIPGSAVQGAVVLMLF